MLSSSPASLARWLVALIVTTLASAPALAAQQEPVWANDLVPKQPPARNAVPAKDDPPLPTDNGSEHPIQAELRALARIADHQTYQDTGDPVVPTIGMVSHRATDLFIEGRGLHFSFDRRYSSHDSATDGPLGFGWDHRYNLRIEFNAALGQAVVHNGNGREDVYIQATGNPQVYDSPPGVYTLLKYEAPSYYILRNREGTKTFFSASNHRVARIEDAAGNALKFFYDGSGRIDYVIDSMGRTIDFSYNAQGRLESIQDFRGRRVEYYYDAAGNLSGVRSPTVASTGGFNDFPDGRVERYTYRPETTGDLAHKLTSIVRPNDVTQGTPPYGTPAVQFQYDIDSNSIFYGWCVAQVLGGTNAAGSAGGTITYAHEVLDYTTPILDDNARNVGRLKARVTNRKGFITDYVVNQNGHVIQVIDYEGSTPFTTTNEYNASGELTKITQPRGNYTTTSYWTGFRHLEGSASAVRHHRGPIASDQDTRTLSFEYEPIFGNLIRAQDFNANWTTYSNDYQEGGDSEGFPTDVVAVLEAELLGIYDRSQILDLLTTFNVPLFNGDLNGDGQKPVASGRVILVEHPLTIIPSTGGAPLAQLEGDVNQQAQLTRTFNQYGQITSETNEEENVTVYLYHPEVDPDGDGVPSTGSNLDAMTGGYLRRMVEDTTLPHPDPQLAGVIEWGTPLGRNSGTNPPAVHKITDYLYDPSGNLVSLTDPRGVRYEYAVSELDERWRLQKGTSVSAASTRAGGINGSTEDLAGQAFAFQELWRFDKNGNVVAHFTQNSGGQTDGVAQSGAPEHHWEVYWTYDILDNVRTEKREWGFAGEQLAAWTYDYDQNENREWVTKPEGNSTAFTWDFRDQVKSVTRGAGSSNASQTTFYYDGNGNLLQSTDGRNNSTLVTYDGHDRATKIVQPLGTEERLAYDPQSNILRREHWGHPAGNPAGQIIEFRRFLHAYDARDRQVRLDREDPQTPLVDGSLTPADGKVTTVFNYDRLGRAVYVIDDDTSMTETLYDGVNRPFKETDPVGNIVEAFFDDNDNLVKLVEHDIYPDDAYRDFETYHVVDSLNRTLSSTDNIGHTERFAYDSRGFVVHRSDAVASLSGQYINGRQINDPGNTTSIHVDGFGRVVIEESDLRVGGTGDGAIDAPQYNPDGRSTRRFTYDMNSRLRFATDDAGNATEYEYDQLDRLRRIEYADGTVFSQDYDRNDNVTFWQDAVGSSATLLYDDRDRLTDVDAAVPPTVVGTTKLRYEYDGLDRQTRSTDSIDSTLDPNDWINEYTWDALDRLKTQVQNGRTVTSTWREESKQTSIGHPSGVTVQYAYDALERVTSVTQGVQLATYCYAGKGRLLQRTDYAGVVQRYHDGTWNDTAYYDGGRRPVKLEFITVATGALVSGIEHGFDRANNRLYTRRVHNNSKGDNFIYDSLYRLESWERNVPAAAVGVPGGNSFDARHAFFLDGAHSRHKTTRQTSASQVPVPTAITVDDVHNYVHKKRGTGPQFTEWNQAFDLNGNKTAFTDQGTHAVYKYDFLNRLRVIEKGTDKVEFDYDAENRRVRTKVTGLSGYPAVTEFVHDGEHVIEEFDGTGTCLRRFYYADDLDEFVAYEKLAFYSGPVGIYFYEQDSAGDVLAIHDQGGNVVERYTYGVFGNAFFETPASAPKSVVQSEYGNPYLFKGLRFEEYYDPLYFARARFLDCQDGSFMQRDPIGVWPDALNFGNPKAYCGANPINRTDPSGLQQRTPSPTNPAPSPLKNAWQQVQTIEQIAAQGLSGLDKFAKELEDKAAKKKKRDKRREARLEREAKKAASRPPKERKHPKVHLKDGKYYNFSKDDGKEYYDPTSGEDRKGGQPFEVELHGPSYCGLSCTDRDRP